MVPLWATIIVGLAGGLLGTFLTIGHERGSEIRTRMVAAADDFLGLLYELAGGVRDLRIALDTPVRPSEEVLNEIRNRLQETANRLSPLQGRIQLLYGDSPTLRAMLKVVREVERMRVAYAAWEDSGAEAKERAIESGTAVGVAVATFTTAARRDLKYGVLSRLAARAARAVHTPVEHGRPKTGD